MTFRRYKKTTPFQSRCEFLTLDKDEGLVDRCEDSAVVGMYLGTDRATVCVSFCKVHGDAQWEILNRDGG